MINIKGCYLLSVLLLLLCSPNISFGATVEKEFKDIWDNPQMSKKPKPEEYE